MSHTRPMTLAQAVERAARTATDPAARAMFRRLAEGDRGPRDVKSKRPNPQKCKS